MLSGNWIKVKAMFTLYRIALAPPRKSYRIGFLFTHKNGCGGVISVTKRGCASPISKVESHMLDTCIGVHTLYRIASQSWHHEKLSGIM